MLAMFLPRLNHPTVLPSFPSLRFPSLPCPGLPSHSLPYLSLPYPDVPYYSFPFPYLPVPYFFVLRYAIKRVEHARQEGCGGEHALSRPDNDALQGGEGELHAHLPAIQIQVRRSAFFSMNPEIFGPETPGFIFWSITILDLRSTPLVFPCAAAKTIPLLFQVLCPRNMGALQTDLTLLLLDCAET